MTEPTPEQAVTDDMILAAQNYDLAHRGASIAALWKAVPDKQVARLIAGAMPAIRAGEWDRLHHVIERIEGLAAACQRKAVDHAVAAERARVKAGLPELIRQHRQDLLYTPPEAYTERYGDLVARLERLIAGDSDG